VSDRAGSVKAFLPENYCNTALLFSTFWHAYARNVTGKVWMAFSGFVIEAFRS